jgi:hypothetical protein
MQQVRRHSRRKSKMIVSIFILNVLFIFCSTKQRPVTIIESDAQIAYAAHTLEQIEQGQHNC